MVERSRFFPVVTFGFVLTASGFFLCMTELVSFSEKNSKLRSNNLELVKIICSIKEMPMKESGIRIKVNETNDFGYILRKIDSKFYEIWIDSGDVVTLSSEEFIELKEKNE